MSKAHFLLQRGAAVKTLGRSTAFGTDPVVSATQGWSVLSLKAGRRRTYLGAGGNDANDGYSWPNRKATWASAVVAYWTGWQPGDQFIMGSDADYTDPGNLYGTYNLYGIAGFSAQYPTAFICCDSTDPLNEAKYGRVLGRRRARVLCPTGIPVLFNGVSDVVSTGQYAFQGFYFVGGGTSGISFTGRHDNILWENMTLIAAGITIDGLSANPAGRCTNILLRKTSIAGPWATNGNASGLYTHFSDQVTCEEIAFIGCGKKLDTHRDDTMANGAPGILGHAQYHSAYNINGKFRLCFYGDSASDGLGMRGDALVDGVFQLDDPMSGQLTGFSNGYNFLGEAPDGRTVILRDHVAAGGGDISAVRGLPRGGGYQVANAKLVKVENALLFDNPKFGSGGSINHLVNFAQNGLDSVSGNISPNQIPMTLVLKDITSYNYSPFDMWMFAPVPFPEKMRWQFINAMLDPHTVTVNSPALQGTNIQYHSGATTFPNAITRAQLVASGGFTCRNDFYNWLIEYPHLAGEWTKVCITRAMRAFNKEPITFIGTTAWPDRSGLPAPTLYYPTSLNALSLSATPVTGVASSGTIVGWTRGSKITVTGAPTGLTIDQFAGTWTYNGTAFAHGSMTLTENWPGTVNDNRQSVVNF